MERKGTPADSDCIGGLQLFNTPGNEVAPRSDIIGKYVEDVFVSHGLLLLWLHASGPTVNHPPAAAAVQYQAGIGKPCSIFGSDGG